MSIYKKGDIIDGYKLYDYLGSGGTAEVWSVSKDNVGKYAMKIFAPDRGMDVEGISLFKEEYKKTMKLRHPNILSALQYGEYDSRPYLIFELCETSLMKVVRKKMVGSKADQYLKQGYFRESELAEILADVSSALVYLHEKGIIHQDIKPDNILLKKNDDDSYSYLLSDFGISAKIKKTIMEETQQLENVKSGLTPDYAAPEQFKGEMSEACDVFSLGVSLYELCSGTTPTQSRTTGIGQALINGGNVKKIDLAYSNRFMEMLYGMMHIKPSKRPSTKDLYDKSCSYLNSGYWGDEPKKGFVDIFSSKIVLYALAAALLISSGLIFFSLYFLPNVYYPNKVNSMFVNGKLDQAKALCLEKNINSSLVSKINKIQKEYTSIQPFHKDISIVSNNNGKMGLIDIDGNELLSCQYDKIYDFRSSDEVTIIEYNNKCGYVNLNGNILFGGINFNECDRHKTEHDARIAIQKRKLEK